MLFHKLAFAVRALLLTFTILAILSSASGIAAQDVGSLSNSGMNALGNYALVFVSRKLSSRGSVYYPSGGIMPGVAGYSRFQVAAPGKLIVRETNGTLRTLIDGSNPTTSSLNLIDVNAPDVSYDGTKIVFAGITAGTYQTGPLVEPGAWRIYVINVNGTGLRQVTTSDRNINLSQFGGNAYHFTGYDDTDPAWLPDGRIVFSSTRWPSLGMYGAVRTTNLHVINADGTGLHRITAEKNGADRPVVDPLTGRIVYSRWWRNFRTATNGMATLASPDGGYIMKDGLCAINHSGNECQEVGGTFNLDRNAWHLASINPDGTGLVQFAGRSNTFSVSEIANHAYGGSFATDGSFYANFFPMTNGTEAAGFGGIRRFPRGANGYTPIIGITTRDESILQFVSTNPNSYGVYVGDYAADPSVLPDGGLLISWAAGVAQDYGLYTINADGTGRTLVYDNVGTTELRARPILPRSIPPVITDQVVQIASALPPLAQGPYDIDGTFLFQALNVYFNAPVDTNIISAPAVGSANTIRFFIDHQRAQQSGSFETLDFPILLKEVLINPNGSVSANLPANVPLFEQVRTSLAAGYKVPLTSGVGIPGEASGAAHVAGLNYGRSGVTATCVGCHAGHTMIPVPANPADAQWTNLAPGAKVTYSSLHTSLPNGNGAIDRKVKLRLPYNNNQRYWLSREGQTSNGQWIQLTFPVPVTVRTVRLYNIPASESSIKVLNTTVLLYSDATGTNQIASATSGALSENGTDVAFNDVRVRSVRILFTSVNGATAGLGEVEVIARGEADVPNLVISGNAGVAGAVMNITGGGQVITGLDGGYSVSVPPGWSGTLTPSHACYSFTPVSFNYTNLATNQTLQNFTPAFNSSSGCNDVQVTVGGSPLGSYIIPSSNNKLLTYPGISGGPVFIKNAGANPVVSSLRLLYLNSQGKFTYSELMGVPASQLSNEYWLPYYKMNTTDTDTQLRFTNTSVTESTIVSVYLGDDPNPIYVKTLAPNSADRITFPGKSGGPLHIIGSNSNAKILAGMRIVYGGGVSFDEVMAYPVAQLSTEYWFPFYNHNNVNLDSELRIANTSGTDTATVQIYFGNTLMDTATIPPLTAYLKSFPGQSGGPVRVVSTNQIPVRLVASLRLLYKNANGKFTFSELMGVPTAQLSNDYWLPYYKMNTTDTDSQIRFTNTSSTASTTVNVYLGGNPTPLYSKVLAPNTADRISFPNAAGGPIHIVGSNMAAKILAGMRVIYGGGMSFDELMAIPTAFLSTEYWFPFYNHNNVNLDTELRISVPGLP